MSLDYALGKYVVLCNLTGTPCNMCRGYLDSRACEQGVLCVEGLSADKFRALWAAMSFREDIESFQEAFKNTGKLPWGNVRKIYDSKTGEYRKTQSSDMFNMFDDFPDDVNYNYSDTHIDNLVQLSTLITCDRNGNKKPDFCFWDEERIQTAKGAYGNFAQRCAIQDFTWGLYKNNRNISKKEIVERLRTNYISCLIEKTDSQEEKKKLYDELMKRRV